MIQVIDTHGNSITGVFRDKKGALVIKDPKRFDQAIREKERIDRMSRELESLNTTVMQLKRLVESLVKQNA